MFLINKVFYEIFQKDRNKIKKLLRISKLITSTIHSSRTKMIWKRTWKKIMQITNVNKRLTFPAMIRHEKDIDNKAKISENYNDLLHSLVKNLKIKFLHLKRESSWECYYLKWEASKGWKINIFDKQSWGFFQSSALEVASCQGMFHIKGVLNNFEKFTGKYLCRSLSLLNL